MESKLKKQDSHAMEVTELQEALVAKVMETENLMGEAAEQHCGV